MDSTISRLYSHPTSAGLFCVPAALSSLLGTSLCHGSFTAAGKNAPESTSSTWGSGNFVFVAEDSGLLVGEAGVSLL